ncbi:hypothetical protein S83_018146 [Arachis hypogaea]
MPCELRFIGMNSDIQDLTLFPPFFCLEKPSFLCVFEKKQKVHLFKNEMVFLFHFLGGSKGNGYLARIKAIGLSKNIPSALSFKRIHEQKKKRIHEQRIVWKT